MARGAVRPPQREERPVAVAPRLDLVADRLDDTGDRPDFVRAPLAPNKTPLDFARAPFAYRPRFFVRFFAVAVAAGVSPVAAPLASSGAVSVARGLLG